MQLEDLMKEMINMPRDLRVNLTRAAVKDIITDSVNFLDEEQCTVLMLNIAKLFIGADNKFSVDEYRLIKEVYEVNMPYEDFYEFVKDAGNPDFIEFMDGLIDALPHELKIKICTFGMFILASDGTVTDAEKELFKKILS